MAVGGRPTTIVARGIRRRCGRCGGRGIFRSYFELRERCPTCGYRFERDEAFFTGVWLLNYGVALVPLLGLLVLLIVWLAAGKDVPIPLFLGVAVAVAVVMPIVAYPIAKSTWAAIDLAMRPLEPVEEAEAALHAADGPGP
jgi:uncharacterized protein (DUF983 family)